jgi:hypothetical protein
VATASTAPRVADRVVSAVAVGGHVRAVGELDCRVLAGGKGWATGGGRAAAVRRSELVC